MTVERLVLCVDVGLVAFQNAIKGIRDHNIRAEVLQSLRSLLMMDLSKVPAKYHLHQLKGKQVASALKAGNKVAVWSMHVTANDVYKVSFTFEEGTMYLRRFDTHDALDKNP